MAAKTKAALSAEQASLYADNQLGQITAATQRTVTQDIIDSSCTLLDNNTFLSPTNSASPTDGSLVVTGGVGIGKDMNVGGVIYGFNYKGPAILLGPATAPTMPNTDNSTNIATTAFVANAIVSAGVITPSNTAPLMDGTAAPGVAIAYSRGDHVHPTDTSRAPVASPSFTGTPTAPTPAQSDNTTKLATTGFVLNQASAVNPGMDGTASAGVSLLFSRGDHVHPTDTSRAPLASPTFTGTVTIPSGASIAGYALLASPTFTGTPAAPTATIGTNTTQLATTQFVQSAIPASPIPSGTVMLFWQSAAPTGWTQVITQNDKALRVVSGTGGVSGGTNAFSTVMAQTVVGNTTISTTTMPSHTHGIASSDAQQNNVNFGVTGGATGSPQPLAATISIASAGSGGAHNHAITMSIQYIDVILASKN